MSEFIHTTFSMQSDKQFPNLKPMIEVLKTVHEFNQKELKKRHPTLDIYNETNKEAVIKELHNIDFSYKYDSFKVEFSKGDWYEYTAIDFDDLQQIATIFKGWKLSTQETKEHHTLLTFVLVGVVEN